MPLGTASKKRATARPYKNHRLSRWMFIIRYGEHHIAISSRLTGPFLNSFSRVVLSRLITLQATSSSKPTTKVVGVVVLSDFIALYFIRFLKAANGVADLAIIISSNMICLIKRQLM